MAALTALALGGSIAGGIGNYLSNKSANDRAAMLQNENLQNWVKINIPDPEQQKIALQQFVVQGKLNPQLEQSIKADPSAFKDVVVSEQNRQAQSRALSELQSIGDKGGLRLQDKAALQDALMKQQAADRGNRESIQSEMSRRGLGGSGFEVASRLQGQQGTSDQAARNSLSVAAQAQERALQAIMGAGDLGTKYRAQDFSEGAQRAQAADKINLFNTQNLQDVQQRNTGSLNRASEMNLAQAQRTADANVNQSNYEQEYNKKLAQKNFENQAQKAQGMGGNYQALANTAVQAGQNAGNTFSNFGQGISNVATAQANRDYWSDWKKKQKDDGEW